jgi:hypothetical protein
MEMAEHGAGSSSLTASGRQSALERKGASRRLRAGRATIGAAAAILAAIVAAALMLGAPAEADNGRCTVEYEVTNQWLGGFQGNLVVGTDGSPVDSWELEFEFPDGQTIVHGWGGTFSQSGSSVTVQSESWNGSIGDGQTATAGFVGDWSTTNGAPTGFTVNGESCDSDGTTTTTEPSVTTTTEPMTTTTAATTSSTTSTSTSTTVPSPGSGMRVDGRQLLDADGSPVVLRGINHPHVWYQDRVAAFEHIADTGANSIRVVLSTGDRWTKTSATDLEDVIDRCQANGLICMLEVHDTTGFGEQSGAISLDQAADYWIEMAPVLNGNETFVMVNIGNEPYGNNDTEAWAGDTSNAISKLRAAGLNHVIVVDAPNWGQDWSNTMQANAESVLAADSQGDTMLSVHMYEVYGQESTIRSYLEYYVDRNLPIMVGEFGHFHGDQEVDEDAILAESQRLGVGWMAWSWSGNSGGVEYLDLTNGFDPDSLTDWGERIVNGPDGIAQTSQSAGGF